MSFSELGSFSELVASLDPPLTVVTTADQNERAGCLVGFHAQSSIDPPRYCVWLSKANFTYRVALRSTHLGVHFLSTDDLAFAELFGTRSGDDVDKFAALEVEAGPGGVPLLPALPNRLLLRRSALLDEGGDHVCIPAEVVTAHRDGPFQPLRLAMVSHLVPGHGSEERNSPPTERAR